MAENTDTTDTTKAPVNHSLHQNSVSCTDEIADFQFSETVQGADQED